MKPFLWKYFFTLCICWVFSDAWADNAVVWRTLKPGLEYTKLSGFTNFPAGYVHAFRVDLQHYHFKVARLPYDGSLSSAYAFQRLMTTESAVVASNGGFFTPELEPLGLRVTLGQIIYPLKAISWWSVFYIQDKTAYVVRQKNYQPTSPVVFAVQAGPLLVVAGKVMPKVNQKIDARTAIGITKKGQVVLVATENLLLSVADLATIMKNAGQQGGLDCVEALNLDGGHSTQIYTNLPDFSLQVSSNARVADAILVVPNTP